MTQLVEELKKADSLLNDDGHTRPTFGDLVDCQKIIRKAIAALDGIGAKMPQNCECESADTTGWTTWALCNVCGGIVEGVDFNDGKVCISRECAKYVSLQIDAMIANDHMSPKRVGKTYRRKMGAELRTALDQANEVGI